MKVNSIEIENFRTIEKLKVGFDGYYTAISGQNNAGKTSLIRILCNAFKDNSSEVFFFSDEEMTFNYSYDKTQWAEGNKAIKIVYEISLAKTNDPGLFKFIEKISNTEVSENTISMQIEISYSKDESENVKIRINSIELDDFSSKEIFQKIATSSLAFIHDSSARKPTFFSSKRRAMHELLFSKEEKEKIEIEQKKLQKTIKKISKAHKTDLSGLLGHLSDSYEVEFAVPDGMFTGAVPFRINLKDKNVDIPLEDWGSGTKNRTQIMMSILQANRIKNGIDENKITPILIIEEPESFLHPSAQAEFGRVLRKLANDLEIQTIVTTHSPYMLCQENPKSNILLERSTFRGKLKETQLVEIDEENWMQPFSEVLGLDNDEFSPWKPILNLNKDNVLLVEGDFDKEYFEFIHSLGLSALELPSNIEVISYGGKDALKNTLLLKFMLEKFDKVFITFDMDALIELKNAMQQLGLKPGTDYLPIGSKGLGKDNIEGLVPQKILALVYGENTDLVTQMGVNKNQERKSAKNKLKKKILEKFKERTDYTVDDLKEFLPIFKSIDKKFK